MRREGDYEERHVDAAAVDVELRELQIELLPQEASTSVGDWLATGGGEDGDNGSLVQADVASEQDGEEESNGFSGVAELISEIFSSDHDQTGAALLEHAPTGDDSDAEQQQLHSQPHLCAEPESPMQAAGAGAGLTDTEQLLGALSAQSDAAQDATWLDGLQSQATLDAHEHKSE